MLPVLQRYTRAEQRYAAAQQRYAAAQHGYAAAENRYAAAQQRYPTREATLYARAATLHPVLNPALLAGGVDSVAREGALQSAAPARAIFHCSSSTTSGAMRPRLVNRSANSTSRP